jgi:hypothetical protein
MTDVTHPPVEQATGATPTEATTSRPLGRDDIKKAQEVLVIERVEMPEWGGHIHIKGISGVERDAYESSMLKGTGRKQKLVTDNVRAKLVALAACDEHGAPLFDPKDADWLGKKGAAALARAYQVAARLGGITDEDIEELAGNSGRDLFGDGR